MPIVAAFPNAVAAFTEKFDFTDVVFAAHINALQAEVVALETILGTLPQGTAATVKARIQALESGIAVLNGRFDSGGQIPQSGVTGLVAALAGKTGIGHTHVEADSHGAPDTDASSAALHHTLGSSPNQASPGSHTHAGVYAAPVHTHAESDVTSLVADIAGVKGQRIEAQYLNIIQNSTFDQQRTWTFPTAFTSAPVVMAHLIGSSVNNPVAQVWTFPSTSSVSIIVHGGTNGGNYQVAVLAVGPT